MRKVLVVLIAALFVSLAAAQSFSVGARYDGQVAAVVEYAHPVSVGSLLVGVATEPLNGFDTEVSLGVLLPVLSVDGADFEVVLRGHLPVYEGGTFVAGQFAASLGLVLEVVNGTDLVDPFFELGVRTDVNSASLTQVPAVYFAGGIRF